MKNDIVKSRGSHEAKMENVVSVAKNLINLYAKPDTSSEVVSQALASAQLKIEDTQDGFVYVVGEDRYRGWADSRHVAPFRLPKGTQYEVTDLIAEVFAKPHDTAEILSKLVLSSGVYALPEAKQGDFIRIELPSGDLGWVRDKSLAVPSPVMASKEWQIADETHRRALINRIGNAVANTATRLIGVPYLWGGCSPFGIDCSGLVQLAYKINGLQLLRDSDIQYKDRRFQEIEAGVAFDRAALQRGDIVAFGKEENYSHIGIALGDGRFVHASGRQRSFGVYVEPCSEPFYLERYAGAIRLSEKANLEIENA
jgi:gamma-D-glutamyl-L-lysine dipeptidyl-peptidase